MAVKYIADVQGGQELTLIGRADYNYWKQQLASEDLVPTQVNSQAEVLISAVALKWAGVRFSELSISIAAHEPDEAQKAGIFLVSAYNTSRLFSFIETNWFRTPYRRAEVSLSADEPWFFQLTHDADTILRAKRQGTARLELRDTVWEGAIYLPSRRGAARRRPEVFFARLAGATQIAPFDPSCDHVQLTPSNRDNVFESLIGSNFTGNEWRVRRNAMHARSATYKRGYAP